MSSNKKDLILNISRLREAIKRKYKQFREGTLATEELLEKQYKPILSELRKTTDKTVEPKEEIKEEVKQEDDHDISERFSPDVMSTPRVPSFLQDEEVSEYNPPSPDIAGALSTEEGMTSATDWVKNTYANKMTRKYMKAFMKDIPEKKIIDNIYGPRYEDSTLMVGDKELGFNDDGSFIIGGINYKPSKGLYELLFKRTPDRSEFNEEDLKTYKSILIHTSAHKKNYKYNGNINRLPSSFKYKNVISKLFPKIGSGYFKDLGAPDPIYYDNPNELCDRLRLIVASAEAGNTSHRNEILSIVEELKELKLIRGWGNRRFRTLLMGT